MGDAVRKCPGCRRENCGGCGIYQKLNTNKQVGVQFPEGFMVEPEEGLGISFDVGTTTLAGMLWDLKDGTLLDAETEANPQAVFGTDVISRIQAAVEDEKNLEKMQKLLIRKLDEMVSRMIGRLADLSNEENVFIGGAHPNIGIEKNVSGCVKKAVVAGNTAMSEILMGMEPEGLAAAPFIPDYKEVIHRKGSELGFQCLENTDVIFLPPIGGYVGADALAVYGYVNFQEGRLKYPQGYQQGDFRVVLMVDIGTNGEILLQHGEKKYACSTAAGPALEGGAVRYGMRAAKGAIDMVSEAGRFPMQDIVCRVIGGGKTVGICGSGLVDALAILYKVGVLDRTGYMRSSREARKAGVSEKICRRIEREGDKNRFLLTDSINPVYLLADDVRQMQLAVSAIRSGIEVLLERVSIQAKDLDKVYLAGAFGSYIGIESGITIGLFPDVPRNKIVQAGNLAGMGAAMALLSHEVLEGMEKESGSFVHVELAKEDAFRERFLEHMSFPL